MKIVFTLLLSLLAPLALAATLTEAQFTAEYVRQAKAAEPSCS